MEYPDDTNMADASMPDASWADAEPTPSSPSARQMSASLPPQSNSPAPSNNRPGFKYKYPQAAPTPDGVDDVEWNKIYTAADSRYYNKHHKSATESKKYRLSGETRELALQMLQEKLEKNRKIAAGEINAPKAPAPRAKPPTVAKFPDQSSPRDGTPSADMMAMGIAEKIKAEGRSRKAPSLVPSEQDPLDPSHPPAAKLEKPTGPPKKRQGKKPGPKPKPKPVTSQIGTPTASARASQTPIPEANESGSSDGSSDDQEYCICRGKDDHRMMVCCEGGCDDWYHCSCMGLNEADVKELLDRFICPKCKTDKLFTTWKRMCRFYNVGSFTGGKACRKAARVDTDPPSKYCSDSHKEAFWDFVKSRIRSDKKPSMGGALSQQEVGWILKQCQTASEIHALGAKPRLPKMEGVDTDLPIGLEFLTPEEAQEIEDIKAKKEVIKQKIEGFQNQQKVLLMVNKRAKIAAQQPNLEVKDICGYDNRLAMNEAQFTSWCTTAEGKSALETGVLGPRTEESKAIGARLPFPGQVVPEEANVPEALQNVCLKKTKKCKHYTWRELHNQEFVYAQKLLRDELAKLEKAEAGLVDDAETREATKEYYSDNVTIQLF